MKRRLIVSAVALVLVGVAFGVVLPRLANYGDVWRVVRGFSWPWLLALAGATALNILTFGPPWTTALPGLGFLQSLQLTQESTAVTLVVPGGAPLGMGVSYGMLRSWGFGSADVGRAVALTGIWSQLSTFFFPIVGALAVAVEGKGGTSLRLVAIVGGGLFAAGVALFVAALWREGPARWLHAVASFVASAARRLRRREPVAWSREGFDRFRRETVALLRERWPSLTIATLANQLTGWLVLDLSLRASGIGLHDVSIADSFAAWSVARLITSLPLTPGGLGFVELGLTGLLVGFGASSAKAVAAVLAYRVLSIVPTLLLGLIGAMIPARRRGL